MVIRGHQVPPEAVRLMECLRPSLPHPRVTASHASRASALPHRVVCAARKLGGHRRTVLKVVVDLMPALTKLDLSFNTLGPKAGVTIAEVCTYCAVTPPARTAPQVPHMPHTHSL